MKNYTITVNGTAYEVAVEEGTGSAAQYAAPVMNAPVANAPVVNAPVAKPKVAPTPNVLVAPAVIQGGLKINSPMPGKILAIKANIGQAVKRGDVILILEAMKMENEIVAPEEGTVASINVSVGDMIEAGILLSTLK